MKCYQGLEIHRYQKFTEEGPSPQLSSHGRGKGGKKLGKAAATLLFIDLSGQTDRAAWGLYQAQRLPRCLVLLSIHCAIQGLAPYQLTRQSGGPILGIKTPLLSCPVVQPVRAPGRPRGAQAQPAAQHEDQPSTVKPNQQWKDST